MKRNRFLQYLLLLGGASFVKPGRLFAVSARQRKRFLNKVKFLWAGALTSTGATVTAKLTAATTAARLVVSTSPQLTQPLYGPFSAADAATNYLAKLSVSGLQPNTDYYYGIEADDVIDTAAEAMGRFHTVAAAPQSFRFTVASCSVNADHPVFYRIRDKNPLFHLVHGDFHYADPNSGTDINVHRAPLEATVSQPALQALLRNGAMAYVWDDHDYCGDNTNAFAAGRRNARLAYQEYVPHYALPAGSGDVAIYQSFSVGRVRFLLTDLRSEKGASGTSILGAAQKAWFKNECLQAKAENQVAVWINSTPWGGSTETDSWAGYAAERTELSDFFKATGLQNLLIICGDIHMIALDDGANYDFSTGAGNPYRYPLLQAAALNQSGSYRGGTYSQGYFLNPSRQHGQYAALDVQDNGGSNIAITITGYRVDGTGNESVLLTHTLTFQLPVALPVRLVQFSVLEGRQPGTVLLQWEATGSSCNVEVERSADGLRFSTLQRLPCTAPGGSGSPSQFTDLIPLAGKAFYRLKLVGTGNEVQYSPVRTFLPRRAWTVNLLTNPAKDYLRLQIWAPSAEAVTYTVVNSAGHAVATGSLLVQPGENKRSVNIGALAAGVYYLSLQAGKKQFSLSFLRSE